MYLQMDSLNCVWFYPDIYQKLIILISIILINHAVEVVGLLTGLHND